MSVHCELRLNVCLSPIIEIDIICIVVWYWLNVHSTDTGVWQNLENATFAWVGRQSPTWPTTGPLERRW